MTIKFIQISELLNEPLGDELPGLLRSAAKCIEAGHLESACWRVADASLLLRRRLRNRDCYDVQGYDTKTGRGAVIGGLSALPSTTN